MRRVPVAILIAVTLPLLVSCQDDLPTWGHPHGELETIRFGSTLSELKCDPTRGVVYAADWRANVIYVIDTKTDEVIDSIPVGSKPVNIELDPPSEKLYVALAGADAVAVVDLQAGEVVDMITVPYEPTHLAAGGDGRIYVGPLDPSDGTTISVDVETGEILHDFQGGGYSSRPVGDLVAVDDEVLVVARSQYLYSFDITDRSQATMLHTVEIDEVDLSGRQMEASSDGELIYVSGRFSATYVEVFRIDGLVRVGELDTEQPSIFVCLSPVGGRAFVASTIMPSAQMTTPAAYVTGFDTSTFARKDQYLTLGTMTSTSMTMSMDGAKLYVVVDNPYRITDNPYGDRRQDIQILRIR